MAAVVDDRRAAAAASIRVVDPWLAYEVAVLVDVVPHMDDKVCALVVMGSRVAQMVQQAARV